ncbi:MAG: 3'-5' exonuclease [Gammaproteobacteria bacterium]|nr:3'-5' exonuclease [Gammaproteobacteria bacterium]NVK87261.1 3'-5' exonuclease [Gammaproteobacteria bacterium]
MFEKWRIARAKKRAATSVEEYLNQLPVTFSATLQDTKVLSLDLETSGFNAHQDRILSIAMVEIGNGGIVLSSLEYGFLRDEYVESISNIEVHGIHRDEVASGLTVSQFLTLLLKRLSGKVLLAHNAQMDWRFLNALHKEHFQCPLFCPIIDTLLIEQRRLERKQDIISPKSLTLSACRARYGLPEFPQHDARNDALATAELLLAQVAAMGGNRQVTLQDLRATIKG